MIINHEVGGAQGAAAEREPLEDISLDRGALGPELGTLFALLVHNLLAAENFNERLGAAVSLAESGEDDARIPAWPVAEARANRVEQLIDRLRRHEV